VYPILPSDRARFKEASKIAAIERWPHNARHRSQAIISGASEAARTGSN
jgi:hypothetical protein